MPKSIIDPSEMHLEEVIDEEQFKSLLQEATQSYFRICNFFAGAGGRTLGKKHYFQLVAEANVLETTLDDFGARHNKTFSFFTELVASVRGFGLAAHSLKHLENRFSKYGAEATGEENEGFLKDLKTTLEFLNQSLFTLIQRNVEESANLGIQTPKEKISEEMFSESAVRKHLSRNVDEEDLTNEDQKIAQVASKFLNAAENIERRGIKRIKDSEKRRKFIEMHCNEERARFHESSVHSLQSKYDTYIKNTTSEKKDPRLPKLRGHISIALHLLEAATFLVHFYERHENDIRSEKAKEIIAGLVDKNKVLDQILNFCFFYTSVFLLRGKPIALGLIPNYTNTQTLEVSVPEGSYLHARPASLIVSIVNHHAMPVEMEIDGDRCNAASIMQLMMMAGRHSGARQLKFIGDVHPLKDIQLLFANKLGETGLDRLPAELSYLKSNQSH